MRENRVSGLMRGDCAIITNNQYVALSSTLIVIKQNTEEPVVVFSLMNAK